MLVLSGRQSVEYSSAVMGAQRVRLDNVESHWIKHDGRDPVVYDLVFFFSSRRRHTRCLSDWSSDVCSSDLGIEARVAAVGPVELAVTPHEPTIALAGGARRLVQKQCVDGGEPVARRVRFHVPEQTVRGRDRKSVG